MLIKLRFLTAKDSKPRACANQKCYNHTRSPFLRALGKVSEGAVVCRELPLDFIFLLYSDGFVAQ